MREQNWRYYDEGERAKSLMISPTMSEGIKHRLNQLDAAAGLFIGAMAYTFERPGAFLSLGLEKFTGVVGQQNVDALASVPEPDLRLAGAALKGVIAWKAVGLAVMADRAKVLALGTQLDFASPRLPNFAMDAIGEQSKLTSAYSRPSQAVLATAEARAAPTVGSALKADPIHRTAVFLLPEAAEKGAVFRVVGGDKVERTLIQMPQRGEKGELGIVEWLMGPKGLEHQRWKAGFGGWGRPN
jgi:hypothetical protein